MKISTQQFLEMIDSGENLQIVDVRTPSEFASAHIPRAVNIPMDEAETRLSDLAQKAPVVLVCQSGNRAQITCNLLSQHHPELLVLDGGTKAWIDSGQPVVTSTKVRWSLERQVRLGAGVLILTGFVLSMLVHPSWIYLSAFVGVGLTFAGLTDICLMGMMLGGLPWNRVKAVAPLAPIKEIR